MQKKARLKLERSRTGKIKCRFRLDIYVPLVGGRLNRQPRTGTYQYGGAMLPFEVNSGKQLDAILKKMADMLGDEK